jgi:hypothetical protein
VDQWMWLMRSTEQYSYVRGCPGPYGRDIKVYEQKALTVAFFLAGLPLYIALGWAGGGNERLKLLMIDQLLLLTSFSVSRQTINSKGVLVCLLPREPNCSFLEICRELFLESVWLPSRRYGPRANERQALRNTQDPVHPPGLRFIMVKT